MKLQLTPPALRLRLAEEELPEFAQAGQLSHTLPFGLTYTLRQLPADAPGSLSVHYDAGALLIAIPAAQARQLIEGSAVSFKSEVMGTDGKFFRILVEKDLGPSH